MIKGIEIPLKSLEVLTCFTDTELRAREKVKISAQSSVDTGTLLLTGLTTLAFLNKERSKVTKKLETELILDTGSVKITDVDTNFFDGAAFGAFLHKIVQKAVIKDTLPELTDEEKANLLWKCTDFLIGIDQYVYKEVKGVQEVTLSVLPCILRGARSEKRQKNRVELVECYPRTETGPHIGVVSVTKYFNLAQDALDTQIFQLYKCKSYYVTEVKFAEVPKVYEEVEAAGYTHRSVYNLQSAYKGRVYVKEEGFGVHVIKINQDI